MWWHSSHEPLPGETLKRSKVILDERTAHTAIKHQLNPHVVSLTYSESLKTHTVVKLILNWGGGEVQVISNL